MADTVVPAAFEHVERSGDVAADVSVRVLQRIAHTRLRTEMHHALESFPCKKLGHRLEVGEIDFHETKVTVLFQSCEARPFERDIVVFIQIVEADHCIAAFDKFQRGVISDESGRTGDENFHNRPATMVTGAARPSGGLSTNACL